VRLEETVGIDSIRGGSRVQAQPKPCNLHQKSLDRASRAVAAVSTESEPKYFGLMKSQIGQESP